MADFTTITKSDLSALLDVCEDLELQLCDAAALSVSQIALGDRCAPETRSDVSRTLADTIAQAKTLFAGIHKTMLEHASANVRDAA